MRTWTAACCLLIACSLPCLAQENLNDEFCGSAPPAHVLQELEQAQSAGHSCCTEGECRCTSLICGGSETKLESVPLAEPPPPDRLAMPEHSEELAESRATVYQDRSPRAPENLPQPPTPPPPERA